MDPKSPSRLKPSVVRSLPSHVRIVRFCLAVVALLLLSAGAYLSGFFFNSGRVSYFSVVVDCGSTGTRVNVYEWGIRGGSSSNYLPALLHSYPDNSTKGTLWKNGCRCHCMQTEPGLDKFVANSSGIRASLEPLIRWAERVIPSERHLETPILVLATAGLRSLPAKDAEWILEDLERVMKDHRFVYRRSWIRVLSGKEEAYYGWVALNYKMGLLDNSSVATTRGLLDLGGSSLQVVTDMDKSSEDDRIMRSEIGRNSNALLAVSIPEFGLNEAFDRSVAMLSAEEQGEGQSEVRHPCLSSSYVQNYTCSNCLKPRNNMSDHWFHTDGNKVSKLVYVVGDPDMELCEKLVKAAAIDLSISDWSKTRTFSSCKRGLPSGDGMNALSIPIKADPAMRFHALSGFFVVYNMLQLPERANLTEIRTKGQQLCLRLWTERSNHSDKQHSDVHYCFKVLYMVSLITDGLCLDNAEIVFGPGDISWTLGASLVEQELSSDMRTSETFTSMISINYQKVLFSPVPVFVILLLALFVVYRYQVKLPMPQRSAAAAAVLPSYSHFKQRPH